MDDKVRYQELKAKLKNDGCNADLDLRNTKGFIFPKEYCQIVIEYLGTFKECRYNTIIVHLLARSKDHHMIPVLLNEFYNAPMSLPYDEYRWYICDGLYVIGYDDKYFDDYMKIAGNVQYGRSRAMVIRLLGRSKRIEALELLLDQMHNWDHDVMLDTLSALNLFKIVPERVYAEVRKFADLLISEKGREKIIKDMHERYAEKYKDYSKIEIKRDIQEMYTLIINYVNKILKRRNDEIPKDLRKIFPK